MYSKEELQEFYKEGFECKCSEAGHCPVFNKTRGKHIHNLCKTSPSHRKTFLGQRLAEFNIDAKQAYKEVKEKHKVDRAIIEMQREGISMESDLKSKGLGDTVEKILGKMGITESILKKAFKVKDCGCNDRKEWLNKIFSYKGTETDDLPQEE